MELYLEIGHYVICIQQVHALEHASGLNSFDSLLNPKPAIREDSFARLPHHIKEVVNGFLDDFSGL